MQFPTYEEYRESWLESVKYDEPSTVKLGNRFAEKILMQWFEYDDIDLDDFVFSDGAGDGGIDAAVLNRKNESINSENDTVSGDTWYLIQSKYGSSYTGARTILEEGVKVIETLTGKNEIRSSVSKGLIEKVNNFRRCANENDRIVLVFATVDPIEERDWQYIEQVREFGRNKLGSIFDVQCVSIRTIYERLLEETALAHEKMLSVELAGNLTEAGSELLIGSISLINFYDFLKSYRDKTGDPDRIFEKNVRKFLGGRVKVNKVMQETLKSTPERFGLFNNGITIVVSDFLRTGPNSFELIEPYIVNGCQTSRSIWEVCHSKLGCGGSGVNQHIENWRRSAENGCIVAKIAKVGIDGEALLNDITRFTNSQNTIRDKDFVSLDASFRQWSKEVGDRYNLFLEIQRGAWESQKALQKPKLKRDITSKEFKIFANATELMKIYSAGWLDLPGLAYRTNGPFIPGGQVFKRVINCQNEIYLDSFGAKDLYAAYLLQEVAKRNNFGKQGHLSRGRTKFLFIFVLITLLREVAIREELPYTNSKISDYVIRLFSCNSDSQVELEQISTGFIDEYFREHNEYGVYKEPKLGSDMFYFIKSEFLGKNLEQTPNLRDSLIDEKRSLTRSHNGNLSSRAVIAKALLESKS